jgi:hypothetical protein
MGPIVDRTKEHLGTSDAAIIAAHRKLLRLARELLEGSEPYMTQHPEVYGVRPVAFELKRDEKVEQAAQQYIRAAV